MSDNIISKYLTDSQMEEIAAQEYRAIIREKLKKDAERIIGNVSHTMIWPAIDEALDGKAAEVIKAKVLAAIAKIGSYDVFRNADHWNSEKSIGQKELELAVKEAAPALKARVEEVMSQFDGADIRAALEDAACDVITSAFNRK